MLVIVPLVWLKSHKNAAVHQLLDLWNAIELLQMRHLLVIRLVGVRRAVEGTVVMSGAVLSLIRAAPSWEIGIHTFAPFPVVRS